MDLPRLAPALLRDPEPGLPHLAIQYVVPLSCVLVWASFESSGTPLRNNLRKFLRRAENGSENPQADSFCAKNCEPTVRVRDGCHVAHSGKPALSFLS